MASTAKDKVKGKKRWNQGGNVGMRCHLELLEEVTEALSAGNLVRLRRSCFGPLLSMAEMRFQGQVYHILLRNHLLPDISDRLCFLIDDKVHELGPVEFALLTGLKFSGDYELPKSSEIHGACFDKKKKLKLIDITVAFEKECEKSEGDSELSLKLAYLIFLFAVLVMKGKDEINLEMQFVHLVDDIEKFNQFPWGRVSYDLLVESTLSRKKLLEQQISKGKKCAYDTYGFVLALQVWAYEVLPDLGRHCALKIEGKEDVFPRMLRWTATDYFHYDDVMRFFPRHAAEPRGLLPPSEEECRQLEIRGLQQSDLRPPYSVPEFVGLADPVRKCRPIHKDGQSRPRKRTSIPLRRSARKAVQRPLDSTGRSGRCPVKDSSSDMGKSLEKDTYSTARLTTIAATVKESLVKVRSIEMAMRSCPCFVNAYDEAGGKQGPGFARDDYESPPSQTKFDSERDDGVTPRECMADVVQKEQVDLPRSSPRKDSFSGTLRARRPFVQNPRLFDPVEASFMDVDAKHFEAWHACARKARIHCETPLPIISQRSVNWDWFNTLMKPRGWLSSEHVDALTNLLLFKYKQNRDRFLGNWTIMEQLGTNMLMKGDPHNVPETLMDYVLGKLPREFGRPWAEARHVIGIANVFENHWVCYVIGIPDRSITVYDSRSESCDWGRLASQFENMARVMPLVCRIAGIRPGREREGPRECAWDVFQFPNPPQQGTNHDSGVMALKFLECLACAYPVADLDPARCDTFRRIYCSALFELGLKHPA